MARLSDIGKMAADDPIRAKAAAVRAKKAGSGGPDTPPKAKKAKPKPKAKAVAKAASKAAKAAKPVSALQKFMESADKGRNIRERGALPKGSGQSAAKQYLKGKAGPLRAARASTKAGLASKVGKAIYDFSPIKPIGDYVSGRPSYLKAISQAGFAGRQGARLGRMLSLGGTVVRVGGRALLPLNLAMTGYDVAKATKEGVGALRASRDLKKTKAHTGAKYGTTAKATATRKSKRTTETSMERMLRRSK